MAGKAITMSAVTPPTGATVVWYMSVIQEQKKLRFQSVNTGASFIITAAPKLDDAVPPDVNRTAAEVMRICASFSDRRLARSELLRSNVLIGSFEWQLGDRKKSINRVDTKYRDASQDYRSVELRISDKAHIAKIHKVSNKEINGNGIDNYFQAYRIGAGELAVERDADFFYRWRAARKALLLEEGDVVAITDSGSGVVNFPVSVEEIQLDLGRASHPRVSFTGKKYSTTLYNDSGFHRSIPVVSENVSSSIPTTLTMIIDAGGNALIDAGDNALVY